jgi:signal transduction histidine kinase
VPSLHSAELRFAIEPLIYQRFWFWPAVAGLIACAVGIGHRLRVRAIRRRFGLILAERTRIARELHDTLLQGMSGVTMQLQALWTQLPASGQRKKLAEIIRDATACSAQARQSLWGLRHSNGESSLFSDKLSALAREAFSGKALALELRLEPVSLRDRAEAECQLLRIAGEAISNALKHAGASRIEIHLQNRPYGLVMRVEDDGAGYQDSVPPHDYGRFGLLGMKERAAEIGASLEISTALGKGTAVTVRLPAVRPFETHTGPLQLI